MPRIRPRGYGLHVRGTMLSCFRRETSSQFFIVKLGKKLPGQGEHLVLASSSRSLTSPYAVSVVPPGTPAQVRSSKEPGEGHNVRTWMKNEPCRCSRARKEKTFYGKYGDERGDSTNQLSELRARGEGSGHVP